MTAAVYETPHRSRNDADAPHLSPVTPAEDARTILINKVSWGAILAGVVTALVSQLILNLIGIGIGASTLDPMTSDNPAASTFSIGAGIWWALSGIVAAFAGGYVASRLSGRPKESTGGWHGLTSWAATTLLVFYLLSTAVGGLVGGAFNTVSSAIGGLGRAAGSAVQTAAPMLASSTNPFEFLERAVRGTTGTDPAALRNDAVASIRDLLTGDASKANEARERASQALARAQNIPVEEARTRIVGYEKQYRDAVASAKQQAAQAADTAAKAVSRGALLGSLALLLGALASWFGGRLGAVDPTITADLIRRRTASQAA
ncbi:PhnA-like protein [uncultured Enterovirga sp.]|uniref:PhnA-like protein n=1 Tax=uncultured Enterovirga sp. TaxID=2026352 RepID=UPI0035CAD0C6